LELNGIHHFVLAATVKSNSANKGLAPIQRNNPDTLGRTNF